MHSTSTEKPINENVRGGGNPPPRSDRVNFDHINLPIITQSIKKWCQNSPENQLACVTNQKIKNLRNAEKRV